MSLTIRILTDDDLEVATAITRAAYRTPRSRTSELARNIALQPDGWFLATLDGKAVGMGGALDYGPFAYVGTVGVLPEAQRRGVATAIMKTLLTWLADRGCPTVLLDASEDGAPLYARLGFVEDDKTLLFQPGDATPVLSDRPTTLISSAAPDNLAEMIAFDTPIFGAVRGSVLASFQTSLPERVFVARDDDGTLSGYLYAQHEAVGPWVCRDDRAAEDLLSMALRLPFNAGPTVIVGAANERASGLLVSHGFRLQRTLSHMRLGPPVARHRDVIFGQASFAIG